MNSNDLYQNLNVLEFQEIQKEVLLYIENHPKITQDSTTTEYFSHVPLQDLPVLESFLKSRTKTKINESSICFVPPGFTTGMHIDGLRQDENNFYKNKTKEAILKKQPSDISSHDIDAFPIANQYVLIIPIAEYNDTINYWYSNDLDSSDERVYEHTREQYPYQFYISFTKEHVVKDPIGSTKITQPTFIKSDIYHNVVNNGPKPRITAVIRFMEYKHYDSLDDIFDCTGLI